MKNMIFISLFAIISFSMESCVMRSRPAAIIVKPAPAAVIAPVAPVRPLRKKVVIVRSHRHRCPGRHR